MFNLESKICEWRKTMQAAGVTDEAVLRELESHLREDFTRILHASGAAEPAFTAALANLGQPEELRQEFDQAVDTPRGRLRRLVFPTNLRTYAYVTLLMAPLVIWLGAVRIWDSGGLSYSHWLQGHFSIELMLQRVLATGFALAGLIAAILYLRKSSRGSALCLAAFQSLFAWWLAYGMVRNYAVFVLGFPSGRFRLWGLYYNPLNIYPFDFTAILLGGTAFYFWRRELLGRTASHKQRAPRGTAAV
jgi:uncharacterized membrane protein YciS (DUF1049 family)